MQVEIWSDVMCPFCYIGKRKFEKALASFAHREAVLVEWKSFQLAPDMTTQPDKNIDQYLAEHKGYSLQQAREMNARVTQMAREVGLIYNFDKAVVANSFDAHRFSHLAKAHGLQNEAEERLFAAYFTEGRNTADLDTLAELAAEIGMDKTEVKSMLASDLYAADVRNDITRAEQIGVTGVPFFVFIDKYAISGAQESDTFLKALDQIWQETTK